MKKILIIGAASAIARATEQFFANEKAKLFLVDLDHERLEAVKGEMIAYGASEVFCEEMNVLEYDSHDEVFSNAVDALGGLDAVLIAHGTMVRNDDSMRSPYVIKREFEINALSVMSIATIAANYFEQQKAGTIAVISSVAGDRGRRSNYVYGSAKGAVSLFLQGLRARMTECGVKVITIKPGQVDTPMTADMPKTPLFSSPETIGKGIFEAMKNGKEIVYLPGYWRLVMWVVKHIPESIFKHLKF